MKFGLDENIIEQIKNVFTFFPEVDEVILFGSRVLGKYKNGSDIDLALKGKSISHAVFNGISLRLDDLMLPYIIDLTVYDKIDNPDLIDHIQRVGVCIYRKMDVARISQP